MVSLFHRATIIKLLAWIQNFLCHRKQSICVNGEFSTWSKVTSRIPQGSILGHCCFWATVCKTVRPILSVRCLSCLSVLFVTFVHCGRTVGRIKMNLGTQVGLGPGHIVLDRDPALPPPKGHSPQFSAHIGCSQMAVWIKMSLGMELGLDPGDFVLDGDPAPPPQKGAPGRSSDIIVRLLQIDGGQIERVSHFKILGLQLSDNLLWDRNVEYICNKISSKLYFLKLLNPYTGNGGVNYPPAQFSLNI